jgi:hypothetical protein
VSDKATRFETETMSSFKSTATHETGLGTDEPEPSVPARTILRYMFVFVTSFLIAGLALRAVERFVLHRRIGEADAAPGHLRNATTKTAYYSAHATEFDTLFIGDSRTLCGIDPVVIDAQIGTHSTNIAYFAHWLDTQYPNFVDLAPRIPKNTLVVWTVGHILFEWAHPAVNMSYSIGIRNAPQYIRWGYSPLSIIDNVATSVPGLDILAHRDEIRSGVEARLTAPLLSTRATVATLNLENAKELEGLRAKYAGDLSVASIDPIVVGGKIGSAAMWMRAGNYRRVEFDHSIFRTNQERSRARLRTLPDDFDADPALWNTFVGILDLFQKYNVNLVVNEVQESPFNYTNQKNAELFGKLMRRVRAEVERRGVRYIRANMESLRDDDYFDHDHLNSEGSDKYSRMLGTLLQSAGAH